MGPLAGIRVVEFAGIGPTPFCAMMLADMGAEVLRIDRPGNTDSAAQHRFALMNRGRRSIVLDLKSVEGRNAALRLIEKADALLEGHRPGVMEALGLSPEECGKVNGKLVYGRMTGWGQTGPLAHAAGHDINYTALSGALSSIGRKGEAPVPPLNLVGDLGGGAMYLAFGIVCALLEARTSGKGQTVDAAMVDGASSMMTMFHGMHASGAWQTARGENIIDSGAPWYDVYETSDRHYVAIGPVEPKFFAEFLKLIGIDDPEVASSQYVREEWPRLRKLFAARFSTATRAEWQSRLEGTDACFAPVLSFLEAVDHPHMVARESFIEIDGIKQPAPAPRFSRSVPDKPQAPRPSGADTIEALRDWGFDDAEVATLCQNRNAFQA